MSRVLPRIAVVLASLAVSAAAHAQSFRTYLASYGKDSNPCSVDQPCRLLPAALAAVANGGEIWILDSANFNPGTVDIAKSVSILAVPGAVGSIVAAAGAPAITISTPGVVVGMRNLVFSRNATNPGTYGIEMTNGTALTVEDSHFTGFDHYAVYLHDVQATVIVKHSTFRDLSDYALYVQGGPNVEVLDSQFIGTKGAANLSGDFFPVTLIMHDSTIASCNTGIDVESGSPAAQVQVLITHARIEHCGTGIVATNGTGDPMMSVFLGDSFIGGNTTGVNQSGVAVYTAGNNQISGNTYDVQGSLTAAPTR